MAGKPQLLRAAGWPAEGSKTSLSLVIPVFNEQENLIELFDRVAAACEAVPHLTWEAILVDDGSRDGTAAIVLDHAARDPRWKLVRLSRNFGHQPAIAAGLECVASEAVVIMDADLQDPPEVIPDLVHAWRTGADVVLARRHSRKDRGLRGFGFKLFHRGFAWLSDFPIPSNTGVFGLIGEAPLKELVQCTERNRFLPGLRSWVGFEQAVVYYDREARAAGEPKQTFARLLRYALDGMLSFSYKPLRLMMTVGVAISLSGFLLASYYIAKRLIGFETAGTGFTTLVCLILFLGGIQLMSLGLVGEYLGRVYDEVKNRPLFIIRETFGIDTEGARTAPPRERRNAA